MSVETRIYPRRVTTEAGEIEFRLMSQADEAAVLDFARKLPVHDLLFLPRDISEPKVLAAWIKEIERGAITSLLAVQAGRVVGCGTLVRDPLSWSPHVGEIRNVVATDVRGQGVGRALTQEIFALALGAGLEKLVVQMTVDQTGAIAIFEGADVQQLIGCSSNSRLRWYSLGNCPRNQAGRRAADQPYKRKVLRCET